MIPLNEKLITQTYGFLYRTEYRGPVLDDFDSIKRLIITTTVIGLTGIYCIMNVICEESVNFDYYNTLIIW